MSEVKVLVKDNGPFLVTGTVSITDAAGNTFNLNGKETFCTVPLRSIREATVL